MNIQPLVQYCNIQDEENPDKLENTKNISWTVLKEAFLGGGGQNNDYGLQGYGTSRYSYQ